MDPSRDPVEPVELPVELPDAVLRYAGHADGLVDLFLPRTGPDTSAPLVVALHGGFWRAAYDRVHLRPLAVALAERGFAVAVPEYRRLGGTGDRAGGWPTTAHDVSVAVASLPGLLDGLGVRVHTMTVVGHSAGGHLALWLANEAHPITRVVGLAPVGDLRSAAAGGLGNGAAVELLGGTPAEVPQRYAEADPASRLATRPGCAVVIVHGSDDTDVPVANSRGLAARFPFIALHELAGAGHFDVIDPTSGAWPSVLAALTAG